ncbi:hypothetical protein CEN49_25270 [Fischerella thermalis CCMEE 5273]|nr:hypothetical protein CEN49_25270 [Fischerella thermalis CCMEE 5273]
MIIVTTALVTIICWGTWVGLSQTVHFANNYVKTFYITLGNLMLAILVVFIQQEFHQINMYLIREVFLFPFLGGVIWAIGSFFAFVGTGNIGIARASGIWTPLNIFMGFLWGIVIFNERFNTNVYLIALLCLSLVLILSGILMIVFAKGFGKSISSRKVFVLGLLGSIGAGVLWGSYFIPIKISGVSMWIANLPFALGMFLGGIVLLMIGGVKLLLKNKKDYLVGLSAGCLWGIGNFGMLHLSQQIGTAKGFTISQLSLLVNALIGLYLFKDPKPKTLAAQLTLAGVLLAGIGGVILGNIK